MKILVCHAYEREVYLGFNVLICQARVLDSTISEELTFKFYRVLNFNEKIYIYIEMRCLTYSLD